LLGRPLAADERPAGERPAGGRSHRPFTRNSALSEVAHTPAGRLLVRIVERRLRAGFGDDPANEALVTSMLEHSPLRVLSMGGVSSETLDAIVDLVNGRWVRGGGTVLRTAARDLRTVARELPTTARDRLAGRRT
jgi:beta-glucosidase